MDKLEVVTELKHHCGLKELHRNRVTGWLVICAECGPLTPGHYTRSQAYSHMRSHESEMMGDG